MKIIGLRDGGFIIDASRDEVYRLIGYHYAGASGSPRLEVGDEIRVNDMYDKLYDQSYNQRSINEIIDQLTTVADSLRELNPVIANLTGNGESTDE